MRGKTRSFPIDGVGRGLGRSRDGGVEADEADRLAGELHHLRPQPLAGEDAAVELADMLPRGPHQREGHLGDRGVRIGMDTQPEGDVDGGSEAGRLVVDDPHPHYGMVAVTVAMSVIGVVLWGTISGSMLPFLLRKLKLDPASASAPAVATIVDVTGIIIYFNVASLILKGVLL